MRSWITFLFFIFVVFSYFDEKRKRDSEFSPIDTKEKSIKQPEIVANHDTQKAEKSNEETKSQSQNFDYEPKSTIERIVTNSVSSFFKTEAGSNVVKNMINPLQPEMIAGGTAYIAKSYNPKKQKYKSDILIDSKDQISICGQKIKLNYTINDPQNAELESGNIEFEIGKHEVQELNILTDEIPMNQVRRASFASKEAIASLMKGIPGNFIKFSVIEHLTKLDIDYTKVKIFDSYISNVTHTSCGDQVEANFKIMDIDSSVISESKIKFRLGDFSFPPILTYITNNMPVIGTRTILLPRKFLQEGENPIISKKNNPNHFIMIEISNPYIL
jgi:hypothetical protein